MCWMVLSRLEQCKMNCMNSKCTMSRLLFLAYTEWKLLVYNGCLVTRGMKIKLSKGTRLELLLMVLLNYKDWTVITIFPMLLLLKTSGSFLLVHLLWILKCFKWMLKQHYYMEIWGKKFFLIKPSGFESTEFPDHVYRLDKVVYGLKQAPKT